MLALLLARIAERLLLLLIPALGRLVMLFFAALGRLVTANKSKFGPRSLFSDILLGSEPVKQGRYGDG